MVDQPRTEPTVRPTMNIPMQLVPAVMSALLPTLSNFLKLNSSPRAKSRKMMPISDHCSTDSTLEMAGRRPRCGLTRNPAMMYPSIGGCFRAREMTVKMPAAIRMTARSATRLSSDPITKTNLRNKSLS